MQSQYVKGQATKWEHSLRGRAPNASGKNKDDQGVTPLQRLTLNGNNLGDEGLDYLCDLLSEEIGLLGMMLVGIPFRTCKLKANEKTALDMQANGITETGARMVSNMLTMNKEIQIVDIRNNAFGIIAQSVLRILKSHINQTDVLLLNDISGSLSLNRQFAIARSVAKEVGSFSSS